MLDANLRDDITSAHETKNAFAKSIQPDKDKAKNQEKEKFQD